MQRLKSYQIRADNNYLFLQESSSKKCHYL
jgi:hypothetical protein